MKFDADGQRRTTRVDHPSGELAATYSVYEQEHAGRRSWAIWLLIKPGEPREIGRQFTWGNVEAAIERSWIAECGKRGLDTTLTADELSGVDVSLPDFTPALTLRKVWTGYFARHKAVEGAIGIAVGPPNWWRGPNYPPLAPTRRMLKMTLPDYNKAFAEILAALDPQRVVDDLYELAHGWEPIILCWEKPEDVCHRHYVSRWLTEAGVASCAEHPGVKKAVAPDPLF